MTYLNWRGPQGRETVDQLSRSDFTDNKSFRAEIRRLCNEYAMCGMGGVYASSRACKGWKA